MAMGTECYRAAFTSTAFRTFGPKRTLRRPFLRAFGANGAKRWARRLTPSVRLLGRAPSPPPTRFRHATGRTDRSSAPPSVPQGRRTREVLHRRQVAVIARGVDDEGVDVLGLDHPRHLLRLDKRLLFEH